jgi:hypothetical protein
MQSPTPGIPWPLPLSIGLAATVALVTVLYCYFFVGWATGGTVARRFGIDPSPSGAASKDHADGTVKEDVLLLHAEVDGAR